MGWIETTILTWRQSRTLLKKMKMMGLFLQDLNAGLSCANRNWNPKVTRIWFKLKLNWNHHDKLLTLKQNWNPKLDEGGLYLHDQIVGF
jgi:hypothetical protein